ncbi:MAG: FAD-binding protein, partial [Acidimicrobiales bacterium]
MTTEKETRQARKAGTRTGWKNWLDDLQTYAVRVDSPTTAGELRRVIEAAVADDVRLKPVGSGHSLSNAAQPSDGNRYVDLSQLSGLIDTTAEQSTWRRSPGRGIDADGDETAWIRVKS